MYAATSGGFMETLEGHSNWVKTVAFSPDGKTLASGFDDNTIKLWDTKAGTELQTLQGHSTWVTSVAFSPDGQTLASGSIDIMLWDIKTGIELQALKGRSALAHLVPSTVCGESGTMSYDTTIA
jgi:WD40 repeat protein